MKKQKHDPVSAPAHYASMMPGIESIDVVQHFNFNKGSAIQFLMFELGRIGQPMTARMRVDRGK